jgi:hypothetical protein
MYVQFKVLSRILAVSVALIITGCSLPSLERSTAESFMMINAALPQEPVHESQFETIGQRPLRTGQIIVPYRYTRTLAGTAKEERFLGYGMVSRRWTDWTLLAEDTLKCAASVPTGQVTFATSQAQGEQAGTLIYGEVLNADVVTVEITLADGQVLQDTSADNMFVLFDPEGRAAQELRALDQDGRVLETHQIMDMHACN